MIHSLVCFYLFLLSLSVKYSATGETFPSLSVLSSRHLQQASNVKCSLPFLQTLIYLLENKL